MLSSHQAERFFHGGSRGGASLIDGPGPQRSLEWLCLNRQCVLVEIFRVREIRCLQAEPMYLSNQNNSHQDPTLQSHTSPPSQQTPEN